MHDPNTCKFKDKLCFGCGRAGHVKRLGHQEKKATMLMKVRGVVRKSSQMLKVIVVVCMSCPLI